MAAIKTFLACSLVFCASVQAAATHRDIPLRPRSTTPVVTVKNGSYEGVYSPEYGQDFFLGMRYAQVRAEIPLRSLGAACCG